MDITAKKQSLEARRAELTAHLSDVEHSLDEAPPKDWEDRASERQGDEVLESLGHVEMAELRRIDAALERIEAGTYGECQKCGEDISEERLDLLPDTPFCKNCAV
ncbi:TraR/DksA family transcriptional regulator [Roseovarius faecimaris]|uniref:TraR/DksA family transcriptional regulator n=1 Tax=Roseovarius faecimaris TaxID=2494550 RepID=A0A6I6IR68_9RHOB|nr:TraR/DksA family transcriptional regulator [Roseovarius faecimaris]QGX97736.1 TraR/DksA family transcriptional regulator [Roseovarius faecimaris]